MRIPHPCTRLHASRLSYIPFNDNSTSRRSHSREHDVCNFCHLPGFPSFLANTNNDLGVQLVLEHFSFACDHGPSFTNKASPSWDSKCRWNDVEACIKEDDLAWWELKKGRSEVTKRNSEKKFLTWSKTAWSASVSSVTPSPIAPKSLTLTKSSISWSAYCGCVFPTILPCESTSMAGFFGAATLPGVTVPPPPLPSYTFPCTHDAIVFVRIREEVPESTMAPFDATLTAAGTFVSLALLMTSDPAMEPSGGWEIWMKIGVLVTVASIIARAPVVYRTLV